MKNLKLVLAPMDGVLDAPMRELLTSINTYYYSVSEFIRIVDIPSNKKNLISKVPELLTGGRTNSGTPVYVQLLGQNPEALANTAKLAASLGALGVDLNFGCPAKQVNKSNGGAALLKTPDLIYDICRKVRDAVSSDIPVTAKMRLGFENSDNYLLIAERIVSAGINVLCVHGRTKIDGYLPNTVRWDLIGDIKKHIDIPLIANGDVFDRESARLCSEICNTDLLMLARGALYLPNLASVINNNAIPYSYEQMVQLVHNFVLLTQKYPSFNVFGRTKQFLSYLKVHYIDLKDPFIKICRCDNIDSALKILDDSVSKTYGNI